METNKITKMSKATISRLPVYLKALTSMEHMGKEVFLSSELSEATGIQDTTIRRDFSYLTNTSNLGKRGKGYSVSYLKKILHQTLGGNDLEPLILVGAGNLGSAILKYNRWKDSVGKIVAAYDLDINKVGEQFGVKYYHLDDLEKTFPKGCRIAILTITQEIQSTVDRLMDLGIIGFVDLTHDHFQVREGVEIQNVDVISAIQELMLKVTINEKK